MKYPIKNSQSYENKHARRKRLASQVLERDNIHVDYQTVGKCLKKDRAKVSLSEFSNFGLLEMTRQRIGLSLLHTVSVECPQCNGLGRISQTTINSNLGSRPIQIQ